MTRVNTPLRSVLLPVDLTERQKAVVPGNGHVLSLLADGLTLELSPLKTRHAPIPEQKARLTRIGGRCPIHGSLLLFDPWSPHEHRCERCGVMYIGREHDDWWAMGAQLWSAERAVHAATLYALRGDAVHRLVATRILEEFAARYATWPNRDNVLGPSRPFFSTYLESIWLLNICHALALIEAVDASPNGALGGMLRENVIAPSATLIAGYHEGTSNRQVWNEVAIMSALRLLDDEEGIDRRLHARGLPWLLNEAVLDDGSWYEGENYHLFAHRGLWYGVQLLRAIGRPLDSQLTARYRGGFVTPFVGVLPDDTFPSRRDSQYGVSIRQWRIAEWCELGFAESGDARIAGVLTRLYDGRAPMRETGRSLSTADAERNAPAAALTRADGSWRALLCASLSAPPVAPWRINSSCLEAQGLAVLRRHDAHTYVALEGGHTGGGHGHPDRLALTLQTGDDRWLEDPGTGSYVDPTLHWYRSTVAHAAPLVNGRSQLPVAGELLAFDDGREAGWIWKRARNVSPGVVIDRTVVLTDNHLVDFLEWRAVDESATHTDATHTEIMLPIASSAEVVGDVRWDAAQFPVGDALEDGLNFLTEVCESVWDRTITLNARPSQAAVGAPSGATPVTSRLWYACSVPFSLIRAVAPGAPGHGPVERYILRATGATGHIAGVWSVAHHGAAPIESVSFDVARGPIVSVTSADGTRMVHARAPRGWNIEVSQSDGTRTITLGGLTDRSQIADTTVSAHSAGLRPVEPGHGSNHAAVPRASIEVPFVASGTIPDLPGAPIAGVAPTILGESHYVQTEQSWADADRPTVHAQLVVTESAFIVDLDIRTGPVVLQPAPESNPLDNERSDTNADGVQWYMARPGDHDWFASALVVPSASVDAPELPVRSTPLVTNPSCAPRVAARKTDAGWAVRFTWDRGQLPVGDDGVFCFDVVVNERPPERERRRGQLVFSGGGGFGYLRGDRHERARALRLRLP